MKALKSALIAFFHFHFHGLSQSGDHVDRGRSESSSYIRSYPSMVQR
jgi:hypothetical protein